MIQVKHSQHRYPELDKEHEEKFKPKSFDLHGHNTTVIPLLKQKDKTNLNKFTHGCFPAVLSAASK
jgi:hypothetical protein